MAISFGHILYISSPDCFSPPAADPQYIRGNTLLRKRLTDMVEETIVSYPLFIQEGRLVQQTNHTRRTWTDGCESN